MPQETGCRSYSPDELDHVQRFIAYALPDFAMLQPRSDTFIFLHQQAKS